MLCYTLKQVSGQLNDVRVTGFTPLIAALESKAQVPEFIVHTDDDYEVLRYSTLAQIAKFQVCIENLMLEEYSHDLKLERTINVIDWLFEVPKGFCKRLIDLPTIIHRLQLLGQITRLTFLEQLMNVTGLAKPQCIAALEQTYWILDRAYGQLGLVSTAKTHIRLPV
ncbi:hypothetical protein BKE30_15230 [Alkanindiges hydrocarboniclasticus]|uniref:Uncharacterized protein n=1 Tax=Alkanindiges hydrocarboniclasticus TaxID=1907941 RepID=A0A1S8CSG3_9GAMM|nr:hypothetical protein [Alkanindiges hydrocarboniclasticus]ONG37128.1 hypothetical protein BKE30_15230 [Alkanindiges hydrocarboniclasticus]